MATIDFDTDGFTVRLSTAEKLAGLLRDIQVPYRAVTSVEIPADGLRATRGMRFPGLALPGRRKIGTWRTGRGKAFVSVARGLPAVRLTLRGHRYTEVLLSVRDAEHVRARLDSARG